MSVLFPNQKTKKAKRSEILPNVLLALSSIHILLIFGLLLVTSSSIFLALPREDVADLGVLRIVLELFLLALTVLGAGVLYRSYQNISFSVMLAVNVVLVAASMAVKHQLGIETTHSITLLGLIVLGIASLFFVEARLYQYYPLGGLAGLGFLAAPALLVPSDLMLTGLITAATVLFVVINIEEIRSRIDSFVPVEGVLALVYLSVPLALVAEFSRDIVWGLAHGTFPPLLMLSAWFAAGLFYLVNAEVSASDRAASTGIWLFALGALAVEFFHNPVHGSVVWAAGAVFLLIGALDVYLQDRENERLIRYGHTATSAGALLTICGLVYSAIMQPSAAISFSGLNVMEVISHGITLGLTHPPITFLILGSLVVSGAAVALTRRSLELSEALIAFSLLYLDGLNQVADRVPSLNTTSYLGWLLFPLAVGLIAVGLYGDWLFARRRASLPYLSMGGWWAVISTVLTLAELQNVQGALLFAAYAALTAYAVYQTGLRPLVAISSTFAALALSYFLLPAGLQPGHIALILLAIAFMFYLISLVLFLAEGTRPLGYTLNLIGISLLALAAFFALAWVKVSPSVLIFVLALGSLMIAIEFFRRANFAYGYVALTVALVAFWLTVHYLPDSLDKLQFYTMSIGAYAVATHILLRRQEDQSGAFTTGWCALIVVLGATFYQLFLMPNGNQLAYFGVLVIQVSLLFFVGLFLHSRLFATVPLGAFLLAMALQLLTFLWAAGSGGLVSIILIMTVIGVPTIMAGIALAVARDSLLQAGRLVQDQLDEWKL